MEGGKGSGKDDKGAGKGSMLTRDGKEPWQPGNGRNLDLEAEKMGGRGRGTRRFGDHDDRYSGGDRDEDRYIRRRAPSPGAWGHDKFQEIEEEKVKVEQEQQAEQISAQEALARADREAEIGDEEDDEGRPALEVGRKDVVKEEKDDKDGDKKSDAGKSGAASDEEDGEIKDEEL
mmetsp:Transcript_18722/g.40141  ORF Transcript_18722/g.40141 Transcript_18722/m.40141 type:complete len:175 (-) Transcript_18722:83-607(-)